jgi:hypothetical protein
LGAESLAERDAALLADRVVEDMILEISIS